MLRSAAGCRNGTLVIRVGRLGRRVACSPSVNGNTGRVIGDVVSERGVASQGLTYQVAWGTASVSVLVHLGRKAKYVIARDNFGSLPTRPGVGLRDLGYGQSKCRAVAGIRGAVITGVDRIEQRSRA